MKPETEAGIEPAKPATEQMEMSLDIEDLEPIIAPGIWENSNETLVTDREDE